MKLGCCFLLTLLISFFQPYSAESACKFFQQENIPIPSSPGSVRMGDFAVHANQTDLLAKHRKAIERSAYFLQTELGWKFPFTRKDLGRPVLEVYFVAAESGFTGTVRSGPVVVLNEKVLHSSEFEAIWIHFLAHASELMYRTDITGVQDYWFYEATAAWMEGQFGKPSANTRMAQHTRRLRPQIPLDDPSQHAALGASLLLELISRPPYRDVIRQAWDRWSYSREERVMPIIDQVLKLNHLAGLKSHVLNYFMRAPFGNLLLNSTTSIVILPYSAAVFQGDPAARGTAGGVHLLFQPKKDEPAPDSASVIYYAAGDKEGTLAIKESLDGPWPISVPFAGMSSYRIVFVNASPHTVRGTLFARFDSTIPAVVEYFRASEEEEGGVLLEWRTTKENGVAFWNLYRIQDGVKEKLNAMPLPASVDSPSGLHYMFVDYTTGASYTLEALTGEGFPSPVATTTLKSIRKKIRTTTH